MSVNLLAICRNADGFTLKRVKTTQPVQNILEGVFLGQETAFQQGITDEVDFDGSWKPDDNELLRSPISAEMTAIWDLSLQNITALNDLDAANFLSEGVKATCVVAGNDGGRRLLIQNFSSRQILGNSALAFVYYGNTFNQLTSPAFTLGTSLSAVLTATQLKFRSYNNVKMIFDLANLYQEATDAQIDIFAAHGSLYVADVNAFKGFADQTLRKLVNAVGKKAVLDNFTPAQIVAAAATATLDILFENGRIVIPQNKADAKKLMHFLDEGFYRGPLSGFQYITNSKRRAN
ncbi:hypothetical protein [Rhizobium laguerreae]|uniref:hypothetical protein n=1 Tax=Rhizobium laguerreae TaxID=1076926 RepID=UPI001C922A93|nr:hypothetical protein [Rhizobium laguerreae]MBY3557645.1 DUF4868 domain-containing protein [Rhizobium laguerreae]